MGLTFDNQLQVGDKLILTKLFAGSGIPANEGDILAVTSVPHPHDRDGVQVSDMGGRDWIFNHEWLGKFAVRAPNLTTKEQEMGLSFDLAEPSVTSTEPATPAWGQREIETLESLEALASTSSGYVRDVFLDCINARYRSKGYRDLVKAKASEVQISTEQLREMRKIISSGKMRYAKRFPSAKGWRYEWP